MRSAGISPAGAMVAHQTSTLESGGCEFEPRVGFYFLLEGWSSIRRYFVFFPLGGGVDTRGSYISAE